MSKKKNKNSGNFLWQDKKRGIFGLPCTFTKYLLTDKKLITRVMFAEEEVRLYRITDVSMKRSLREVIWRMGTIHCCSSDDSTPEFDIKHIKHPRETKELLSDLIEEARKTEGLTLRENVGLSKHND